MSELHVSLEVPRLSCSQRLGKSWLWEVLGPRPKAEGPGGASSATTMGPCCCRRTSSQQKARVCPAPPEGYLFWGALFVFALRHYFFAPGEVGRKEGRQEGIRKAGRKKGRTEGGRKEGKKEGRKEYTYTHTYTSKKYSFGCYAAL